MNKEHDLSLKVDHIEWHQVSQEDKRGCGVSGVERLERAKKIIKDMVEFIENVSHIGKEDTEYLDWLVSTVEEQQKEIDWYQMRYENTGALMNASYQRDRAMKLEKENARLRKALGLIIETSDSAYIRQIVRKALKE